MTEVHPVLATGPAAEGYGPALSVVLDPPFRNYVAGSVVLLGGNRINPANSFKRHQTSAKLFEVDVEQSQITQPAFFIDTPTAQQEKIAVQTDGVLTVKVKTDKDVFPAPGSLLYAQKITNLFEKKYTILTTQELGIPVATVLNAERRDGTAADECDCRVFVLQRSYDSFAEISLKNLWDRKVRGGTREEIIASIGGAGETNEWLEKVFKVESPYNEANELSKTPNADELLIARKNFVDYHMDFARRFPFHLRRLEELNP